MPENIKGGCYLKVTLACIGLISSIVSTALLQALQRNLIATLCSSMTPMTRQKNLHLQNKFVLTDH
jgi:hypothetical protein